MQPGSNYRAQAAMHLSLLAAWVAAPKEAAAACGPARCVTNRRDPSATQHSYVITTAGLVAAGDSMSCVCSLGLLQHYALQLEVPATCIVRADAFADPASGPSTGSSCCRCDRAKSASPACIKLK